MHHVVIHQRLVASDADGWLQREVDLPFTPFAGLAIRGIRSDPEGDPDEIAEVTWDVHTKVFHVWLHGDEGSPHMPLAAALEDYGPAWTFHADQFGKW